MKKINVKQVFEEMHQKATAPRVLPKIVRASNSINKPKIEIAIKVDTEGFNQLAKDTLLASLEIEFARTKKERDMLSSQIWKMVANGSTTEELKNHYHKIEGYRPVLIGLYDKIEYVKQHGELPGQPTTNNEKPTTNLLELREQKRSLINRRSKLKVKLQPSAKPSKPDQIIQWQMELAQLDAEYFDVDERIKELMIK